MRLKLNSDVFASVIKSVSSALGNDGRYSNILFRFKQDKLYVLTENGISFCQIELPYEDVEDIKDFEFVIPGQSLVSLSSMLKDTVVLDINDSGGISITCGTAKLKVPKIDFEKENKHGLTNIDLLSPMGSVQAFNIGKSSEFASTLEKLKKFINKTYKYVLIRNKTIVAGYNECLIVYLNDKADFEQIIPEDFVSVTTKFLSLFGEEEVHLVNLDNMVNIFIPDKGVIKFVSSSLKPINDYHRILKDLSFKDKFTINKDQLLKSIKTITTFMPPINALISLSVYNEEENQFLKVEGNTTDNQPLQDYFPIKDRLIQEPLTFRTKPDILLEILSLFENQFTIGVHVNGKILVFESPTRPLKVILGVTNQIVERI